MSSSYNCYDSQWRSDGYFSEKAFYDKNKPNLTTLRIGYSLLIKEKRILSFICIFFILGITWSSFLLYVHHILPFFSYLFIILNGTTVANRPGMGISVPCPGEEVNGKLNCPGILMNSVSVELFYT